MMATSAAPPNHQAMCVRLRIGPTVRSVAEVSLIMDTVFGVDEALICSTHASTQAIDFNDFVSSYLSADTDADASRTSVATVCGRVSNIQMREGLTRPEDMAANSVGCR